MTIVPPASTVTSAPLPNAATASSSEVGRTTSTVAALTTPILPMVATACQTACSAPWCGSVRFAPIHDRQKEASVSVAASSSRLHELVDESVQVEQLGSGFTFTEGPIWNQEGRFLLFSDMPGDTRRRWDEQNGVEVVLSPSNKGNGMTLDANGRLIVCEHSTSSVVRMDPDGLGGGREVLATHYRGKELNSPNDVVVHSSGAIYFSDPTYGRMPGFGIEREQDLDFQGVYRIPPGGGDVQVFAGDFAQPNGLCFSPDESLLYVNDTDRAHIRVFGVGPNHELSNGRVFADGIGTGELARGERSEEHTSELQSHSDLVCRLLLEKKNGRGLGGRLAGFVGRVLVRSVATRTARSNGARLVGVFVSFPSGAFAQLVGRVHVGLACPA